MRRKIQINNKNAKRLVLPFYESNLISNIKCIPLFLLFDINTYDREKRNGIILKSEQKLLTM